MMTLDELLVRTASQQPKQVDPLAVPVIAGKTSPLYRVHSYHTKVPPDGIRTYIAHYTNPGDVVLDPFCGSGMTGLAALLEGRHAILSDVSPAAVHIAANYCMPCDPSAFQTAVEKLLQDLASVESSLYGISCPECGTEARIEYTVWSDLLSCPFCHEITSMWNHRNGEVGGLRNLTCPACSRQSRKSNFRYVGSRPVLVSCNCWRHCGRFCSSPTEAELERIGSLRLLPISHPLGTALFNRDREMWRGGHDERGIRCAADFYTARNLRALATIKTAIESERPGRIRQALLFAFTSIVNRASRRYQWNAKRPTNVLTATLYVPSLNYEFNVFSLLRRKVRDIRKLFGTTAHLRIQPFVRRSSATDLSWLPDASVDYVFADPPFGSNIFYADSSFLWEAWLGEFTDESLELVVNKRRKPSEGGKSINHYQRLMSASFAEISRVLKPGGWASIMFHNSDDQIWEALRNGIEEGGLQIANALVFDKRQPSFKGVKSLVEKERVPFFDVVISARQGRPLRRTADKVKPDYEELRKLLTAHLREATPEDLRGRNTAFIHSLVVRICLQHGWSMEGLDYKRVEALCEQWFANSGDLSSAGPRHNVQGELFSLA